MIDKLEVGKKYVDKIGTVYIVVSYDSEKDLYIARHAGIKTYPEYYGYHGDGKLFDGVDNSAFDLIKEYTEPKTVSGYAVVSVDEDDNMKFETRLDTLEFCLDFAKRWRHNKIIHLDNIKIEEA